MCARRPNPSSIVMTIWHASASEASLSDVFVEIDFRMQVCSNCSLVTVDIQQLKLLARLSAYETLWLLTRKNKQWCDWLVGWLLMSYYSFICNQWISKQVSHSVNDIRLHRAVSGQNPPRTILLMRVRIRVTSTHLWTNPNGPTLALSWQEVQLSQRPRNASCHWVFR